MENINKNSVEEEGFDFKKLIYKCLNIWYLFVIVICVALAIAYLINKFSTPIFKTKTTVLVYENQSNLAPDALIGINLYQNQKKLKNEIAILQSYSLTKRAIEKLDFEISYFNENIKPHRELYSNAPFQVVFDNFHPQAINIPFHITFISDSTFALLCQSEEGGYLYDYQKNKIIGRTKKINEHSTLKFGQLYDTEYLCFRVLRKANFNTNLIENNYSFKFNSKESLISKHRNVEIDYDRESSVLVVSTKGNNVEKSIKYLNTLIEVYLEREVEKKNQIALKTLTFIDRQLNEILDSLNISESQLQNFRSTYQIMDVDWQTEQVFSRMEGLQDEKAALLIKIKYYESLQEYLTQNNTVDDLVAPSAIGIDDPLLNKLIINLISYYSEKSELLANSVKTNPHLSLIELQIKTTKESLLKNIENIIIASNISLNETNLRIETISKQIDDLPRTQRQLFGFERKFKLNDAIYTYLLQKRSETQIAKASNLPVNEVLDPAMISGTSLIYPKIRINYILAFLIGFAFPILFLLLKDYFNDKISDLDVISKITNFPILGYIIHNTNKGNSVVEEYPLSSIAESFRSIRTNFQFISHENRSNVIVITSSMKGEGKSFTSLNLASSFALNNKKTVLLLFDLRNPKLYMPLERTIDLGLSNYLINKSSIEDIIQKTHIENLNLIHAGPIPPNPTELISTGRTGELMENLKSMYDYVIIDTPPIGIVSDFLLLVKYSDIILFLLRHNYTPLKMLKQILNEFETRKIDINIIVNDINFKNSYLDYRYGYGYGYRYGYGYGYGYGYTYDKDKKTKNSISNLVSFRNFKSNFNLF